MEYLSLTEFTYNNTCHESANGTPFFLNYRFNPKFDTSNPDVTIVPRAEIIVKELKELTWSK